MGGRAHRGHQAEVRDLEERDETFPSIPSWQVEELGAIFESGGADVTISWR